MSTVVAVHLTDRLDSPYIGMVIQANQRWQPIVSHRACNVTLPGLVSIDEAVEAVRAEWRRREALPPALPTPEPEREDLAQIVEDLSERHEACLGQTLAEVEG